MKTLDDLIKLHIADMREVGKVLGRSKAFSLKMISARLGKTPLSDVNREKITEFGKARAKEGAGPVTAGIDVGYKLSNITSLEPSLLKLRHGWNENART